MTRCKRCLSCGSRQLYSARSFNKGLGRAGRGGGAGDELSGLVLLSCEKRNLNGPCKTSRDCFSGISRNADI